MSNVPSFETVACDEIVRINKLLQSLRERAEKAERELADELTGNSAMRRDFGALDDETMCEFVARLVATVKELKLQLGAANLCSLVGPRRSR
jgi:hypothetical protein